jgi:serine/threonine protein kinase
MSPENFDMKLFSKCDLKKCDVWSVGVIIYQIITNSLPFKLSDNNKPKFTKL